MGGYARGLYLDKWQILIDRLLLLCVPHDERWFAPRRTGLAMPEMNSTQLTETWAHVMDIFSRYWEPLPAVPKTDLLQYVAAMDKWLDGQFPLVSVGDSWDGHPTSYFQDHAQAKPSIHCPEIDAAIAMAPVSPLKPNVFAYAVAEKRAEIWKRPEPVEV
jgi:hypothetical protein